MKVETEFEDVLGVLGAFAPVEPPANLEARFRTLAEGQLEARSPLEETLEEHGPTVLGYLEALLGSQLGAEHALLAACGRLDQEETPALADLLLYARHAALESLSKTGPSGSLLSPDERALLLERRLGLRLVDLARTWSTMPVRLRERLLSSTERLLTLSEAARPDTLPACDTGRELLVAAPADLLKPADAERYAAHCHSCAPCGQWSQTLEDALTTKTVNPSTPWKQLATHRELVAPREDLGIRVSVSCCYCHDTLQRHAAAFCAACLAPHHAECFEGHAGCSTPGCAGTDLVHPRSVLRQRSGLSVRDKLGRGLLVFLLTGLGTVAALTATKPFASTSATIKTAESISEATPIPTGIKIGASKTSVVNALGAPEAEETEAEDTDGPRSVLSWYSRGVRAEFDDDERLIKASFFGVADSAGAIDANGNKPLFDRNVGWYRAKNWSWRGVEMGMLGPAVIDRLREADSSIPDANGNIFLLYTDTNVVIELHGDRMSYEVVAIHFGGKADIDGNGNGFVEAVDLTTNYSARAALALGLAEANRLGSLRPVLKEQAYLQSDSKGKAETLYRVSGALAPDGVGLDLKFDIWSLDESFLGEKREERVRLAWDGRVLSFSERWIEDDGKVVFESHAAEDPTKPLWLKYRASEQFKTSANHYAVCSDATLPYHVGLFVLSRLAEHLGDEPWRMDFQDGLSRDQTSGVLRTRTSGTDYWNATFVRNVDVLIDTKSQGPRELRIRVSNNDGSILFCGSSENTGALKPISKAGFNEASRWFRIAPAETENR